MIVVVAKNSVCSFVTDAIEKLVEIWKCGPHKLHKDVLVCVPEFRSRPIASEIVSLARGEVQL
jgi:hypothetical protein